MTEDFIDGFEAATRLIMKRLDDQDDDPRRVVAVIYQTLQSRMAE